ncbi:MAG: dihydroxyacetone kinase subunit DhaK [Eubacteriales bacterium]|nr:dihydroxyacetone kinase subunit DhaK [Eubacteriales bacterium]
MKKFMNDPFEVTNELVEGFVIANEPHFRKLDGMNVVVKKEIPENKKATILIGGGSGHEPLFLEFIGKGMGDCAVHGNIFASPSVDMVYEGIKAANTADGVIMIYGNYQGDILNFEMAQEMARMEGIRVDTVRVWDDVASADAEHKEDRRGTSADLPVIKIAGAASEKGLAYDEVLRIVTKARDNCRSIGISLSSCTLPAVGEPIFHLAEDEMYVGMGVHGEPGVEIRPFCRADEAAKILFDKVTNDDLPIKAGDEAVLVVNSYGATTRMELLIIIREIKKLCDAAGIGIHAVEYGDLCTSQEMAGVSFTMMKLDDELKALYDEPAVSPGFSRVQW